MYEPILKCFGREPLTTSATAVLVFLTANAVDGEAHVSAADIGQAIRAKSSRTVTYALHNLRKAGAITDLGRWMKDGKLAGKYQITHLVDGPEG